MSLSDQIHAPPVRFYPERGDDDPGWLDEAGQAAIGICARGWAQISSPVADRWALMRVLRLSQRLSRLDEAAFNAEILRIRMQIRRRGLTRWSVLHGLALVRETCGREINMRHYPVQIRGALAMLRGRLIEMDTGEGKTITAGLAAGTAAMAGMPVHVITVNNYLAERDCETLAPVYRRLGLRPTVILEDMAPDDRRDAYRAEITYGSNTEMAFDYLRDRIRFGTEGPRGLRQRLRRVTSPGYDADEPVMRGLHFAIVDEADSVLADEARTPLIISHQTDAEEEAAWAERALAVANDLNEGRDFKILRDERRVELTETGRKRIGGLTAGEAGLWQSVIRREEIITRALSVLHIFEQGDQYLVRDDKVQIVDEYTGRLQPDRSWSDGLHQLVEAKEGVEITGQNLAVARMTYQRLYRRYVKLAGMSGTVREVAGEMRSVYGLVIERIPPHRRSKLRQLMPKIYRKADRKWAEAVRIAKRETDKGRAVLVGTRSVAASLTVSEALTQAGLEHRLLNAENDDESADVVAEAGQAGRITVATNMAGRGVDIALGPGVAEAGGLHVILTERHDAGRIDRQLAGRAGRRGEPGSVSVVLSLEDPLLKIVSAPVLRVLAQIPLIGLGARIRLFDRAQKRAEKSHARARRDLVRQDRRLNKLLSFTGGLE